jgi:peptidoglycan/LPS O-acetylase OafA/YrhL
MSAKFYPRLEGLRGFSIVLVMISHYIIIMNFPQLKFLNFGFWGVNLFFVLSGFLITGILLRATESGESHPSILKGFYARRVLRIFPIYYLTILLLFLFRVDNSQTLLPYLVTYTLNLGNIWWNIGNSVTMHFWSLCVEEQFYLFWPVLLIKTPKKYHLLLLILIVISSVVLRAIYQLSGGPGLETFGHSFTFSCMDSLGAGGLLAYLQLHRAGLFRKIQQHWVLPTISAVTVFIVIARTFPEESFVFQTFGRLLCSVTGFFLLATGVSGKESLWGRFMGNNWLRYLGRISYGVYIYHWILFFLLDHPFKKWWGGLNFGPLHKLTYNTWIGEFLFFSLLSVVVASFSYYIVEKPFLQLKGRLRWQ